MRGTFFENCCGFLCYNFRVPKTLIRKRILAQRELQKPAAKAKKDKKILQRTMRFLPFRNAKTVFTYLAHRGEVCTDELIKKYLRGKEGRKKIIVPKMHRGRIQLHELKNTDFVKGKFGVREPVGAIPVQRYKSIGLALVPGIAFDLSGHRIGFGGGHFDRLLKKMRCIKIGLAYEFQIIDKVPTHKYDIPVDYVITEKRVIKCSKET